MGLLIAGPQLLLSKVSKGWAVKCKANWFDICALADLGQTGRKCWTVFYGELHLTETCFLHRCKQKESHEWRLCDTKYIPERWDSWCRVNAWRDATSFYMLLVEQLTCKKKKWQMSESGFKQSKSRKAQVLKMNFCKSAQRTRNTQKKQLSLLSRLHAKAFVRCRFVSTQFTPTNPLFTSCVFWETVWIIKLNLYWDSDPSVSVGDEPMQTQASPTTVAWQGHIRPNNRLQLMQLTCDRR